MRVAHLTTVDLSLRYLVFPQLLAVIKDGGEAMGISAPGPFVAELEEAGIRHLPLPSSTRGMDLPADVRAVLELWRILRREDLDVLHTHNPKPGLYGRILGRVAGIPVVVNTVHGLYAAPDDPLPKRLLVYALEAIASRFSDAELVQNPEDLELLRRWRITPRSRTKLLGNGVDLTRFDPARLGSGVRGDTRTELGVRDDQILVGIVGRLVAEKGYPELFEAIRLLEEDRYVLVCIGPDDPDKSDAIDRTLVEQAADRGVLFLGMRTDVDLLYAAMDLFVLPSHREGFPRAAMEAAAMGIPIVATDIRGCREVVDDGTNGLLVPVREPDALAAAIRRLGEDPNLRSQMGAASRSRALERFDEQEVVAIVLDTYRDVALRKGLVALLPSGGAEPLRLRPASRSDAIMCARLHAETMPSGFLPRLGVRFLSLLYQALIGWPGSVVLVAEIDGQRAGFVAGTIDTNSFYRFFLRRYALPAAVAALPRVLRPSNLRRAWETLRYRGPVGGVGAELVSLAVAGWARRRGVGHLLGTSLLDQLSAAGAHKVRVVVGADNAAAISAYNRMGFVEWGTVEVHAGEPSVVMVWPR